MFQKKQKSKIVVLSKGKSYYNLLKFLIPFIFLFSCKSSKYLLQDGGKVVVKKVLDNNSSTILKGNIYELSTGEKLKLSDIWLNNKRYVCDSTGFFQLNIRPGRYHIEARSFGLENYKYKIFIKKGSIITLSFYLVPFKQKKPYTEIH